VRRFHPKQTERPLIRRPKLASTPSSSREPSDPLRSAGRIAASVAIPGLAAALALVPHATGAAAAQDWPPFVLVTGLLALGLVARADGLFDAAGTVMADLARGGRTLFAGAAALLALVTAILNLDTAVAFLTPVVVVAARRRRTDETPFLYLAVFMANGASLLLPGSNLTNLIVLGSVHQSGGSFVAAMALAWVVSIASVSAVVALIWWRPLGRAGPRLDDPVQWRAGAGLAGIVVVIAAMLALAPSGEAIVALVAGAAAAAWTLSRKRIRLSELRRTLNLTLLVGLFAVAVDLGTLGRVWSGPARLLSHASSVVTAIVGAGASIVVNNLPAASLLAARTPAQPHALLIGLDLGPNLAVTGALSAVLWLQVSRTVDARPSIWRYSAAGALLVPVSMALALLALGATR
jgi:arsenical pump membrane protein